jgi:hypothetical protein
MTVDLFTVARRLPALCVEDGEFQMTARYWNGALRLGIDGVGVEVTIVDGVAVATADVRGDPEAAAGHVGFDGPGGLWLKLLAPVPEPMHNDIAPVQYIGMRRTGDRDTYWQYFPAIRRVIDLMREEGVRIMAREEASAEKGQP